MLLPLLALVFAVPAAAKTPPLAVLKLPGEGLSVELVRGGCRGASCLLTLVLKAGGKEKDRLEFEGDRAMEVPDGKIELMTLEGEHPPAVSVSIARARPDDEEGGASILSLDPAAWGSDAVGLFLRLEGVAAAEGLPNTEFAAVAVRGGKFVRPWRSSSYQVADENLESSVSVAMSTAGPAQVLFSASDEEGSKRAALRWDPWTGKFVFTPAAKPEDVMGSLAIPGGTLSVDFVRKGCGSASCGLVLVLKSGGAEKDRLDFGADGGLSVLSGAVGAVDQRGRARRKALLLSVSPRDGDEEGELSADVAAWEPGVSGFLFESVHKPAADALPTSTFVAVAVRDGKFARPWRGTLSPRDQWQSVDSRLTVNGDAVSARLSIVANATGQAVDAVVVRWRRDAGKFTADKPNNR